MRYDDVVWLTAADVVFLHDEVMKPENGGGEPGMLNAGALDSACAAAAQTVGGEPAYPSLAAVAAALCFGIAKGHAFRDGNKRAAITAAGAFLEANGYPVQLRTDLWERIVNSAASGRLQRSHLRRFFRAVMRADVPITA